MANQTPPKKKAATKKTAAKKTAPKKAAVKTTPVRKTTPKKTAAKSGTSKRTTAGSAAQRTTERRSEFKLLPGLMQNLQSVFDKIHTDNQFRDDHQDKVIEDFSQRLSKAFEQTHQASREREKLLQDRLAAMEKEQSYRIQRIKLFSLPGTIIAVAALIYLFYVVNVMERSMTSMSADMHRIENHIAGIGQDTNQMSGGVVSMDQRMAQINDNIQQIDNRMGDMNGNMANINSNVHGMNRNVGVMTNDVGAMSHTVSPVMNNMRKFMPMF